MGETRETTRVLKRDWFGQVSVETSPTGELLVCRDLGSARLGLRWLARRLARREARALERLATVAGVPRLFSLERNRLVRSFIPGRPLHEVASGDVHYFRRARRLVSRLHREGVAHNDLAKEPNLLVTPEGRPALVDFQLARVCRRRSAWFRLMAREDLRHLLKHKRTYCPERLTDRERRLLGSPSCPARVWRSLFKPVYHAITRGLFGWADREGAGERVLR